MKGGATDPVHRHICRATMIHRSKLVAIPACRLLMGDLCGRSFHMRFPHCYLFLGSRSCGDAAGTVETGAVHGGVVYHRTIDISVVYHCSVDIYHRGVIAKMTSCPYSASKSDAAVAKS